MLVFKNNIYEAKSVFPSTGTQSDPELTHGLDPYEFIKISLLEEKDVVQFVEKQPRTFWDEDARNFYPNACKFGSFLTLRKFLFILLEGLGAKPAWHEMNAYHFCYLYDVLSRNAFNYNADNREERINSLPHLNARPLNFNLFVRDYFFNTGFLTSPDHFNSLSGAEKKEKGMDVPCLFSVINGLKPCLDEMVLKETRDYPYTLYV